MDFYQPTNTILFPSHFLYINVEDNVVQHVTGNDKDFLRKIPRVVW